MQRVLLLVFSMLMLSGCQTVVRPTIAHVHIAHTVNGWSDTPGKVGLIVVANQEAVSAREAANLAVAKRKDADSLRAHVKQVELIINGTQKSQDSGSSYGYIRAMKGAVAHVGFAANSVDASENLKSGVLSLERDGALTLQTGQLIAAVCREADKTERLIELAGLADELKELTDKLVTDTRAWQTNLQNLISREKPPYEPVATRYLFGLIRLPSGVWQWRDDVDGRRNQESSGGGY